MMVLFVLATIWEHWDIAKKEVRQRKKDKQSETIVKVLNKIPRLAKAFLQAKT